MIERKPPVVPFSTDEIKQFVDHFTEHGEYLRFEKHAEHEGQALAEFLGLGYLRYWTEKELTILRLNYESEGAMKTAAQLPYRTVYDVQIKAYELGLRTDIKLPRQSRPRRWEGEEEAILSQYWSVLGYRTAVLLPDRTEHACSAKADILGLRWRTRSEWTDTENQIILEHYAEMGSGIQVFLPGKSLSGIRMQAHRLGVSRECQRWSKREDDLLRKHFPVIGEGVSAYLPGRSTEAAVRRASELGIKKTTASRAWTDEENELLRKHYPSMGRHSASMIPTRSEFACAAQARKLGLNAKGHVIAQPAVKWTSEEIEVLRKHYPSMKGKVVQLLPRHTKTQCISKATDLHLGALRLWSEEEDQILKKFYPTMGKQVVDLLPGRTVSACHARANDVLKLPYVGNRWTAEEDAILRKYYPSEGTKVAVRLPGRSNSSCKNRADSLGVRVQIASSKIKGQSE